VKADSNKLSNPSRSKKKRPCDIRRRKRRTTKKNERKEGDRGEKKGKEIELSGAVLVTIHRRRAHKESVNALPGRSAGKHEMSERQKKEGATAETSVKATKPY